MIARSIPEADTDVLVCACLLHDIGRAEQNADPSLCHAAVGAGKAENFLLENGYPEDFAKKVRTCIASHRFRGGDPPADAESRILFDADKLDVCGALGAARTLLYQGRHGIPLCEPGPDGLPSDGTGDEHETFFREYRFKLSKLYDRFLTAKGAELARERRAALENFCASLLSELRKPYTEGPELLSGVIREENIT